MPLPGWGGRRLKGEARGPGWSLTIRKLGKTGVTRFGRRWRPFKPYMHDVHKMHNGWR